MSDRAGRSAPNRKNSGRLSKGLYKGPGDCTRVSVGDFPAPLLRVEYTLLLRKQHPTSVAVTFGLWQKLTDAQQTTLLGIITWESGSEED